jgi:hypothetical protein
VIDLLPEENCLCISLYNQGVLSHVEERQHNSIDCQVHTISRAVLIYSSTIPLILIWYDRKSSNEYLPTLVVCLLMPQ